MPQQTCSIEGAVSTVGFRPHSRVSATDASSGMDLDVAISCWFPAANPDDFTLIPGLRW